MSPFLLLFLFVSTVFSQLDQCSDDVDDGSIICVFDLMELPEIFQKIKGKNLIVEAVKEGSTILEDVCNLYESYNKCLFKDVFEDGKRCRFLSPMGQMPRLGLGPFCQENVRNSFDKNRDCVLKVAADPRGEKCLQTLLTLESMVGNLLRSSFGPGNGPVPDVCKIFSMILGIFTCMEPVVVDLCDSEAQDDFDLVIDSMQQIGIEEGCIGGSSRASSTPSGPTTPKPTARICVGSCEKGSGEEWLDTDRQMFMRCDCQKVLPVETACADAGGRRFDEGEEWQMKGKPFIKQCLRIKKDLRHKIVACTDPTGVRKEDGDEWISENKRFVKTCKINPKGNGWSYVASVGCLDGKGQRVGDGGEWVHETGAYIRRCELEKDGWSRIQTVACVSRSGEKVEDGEPWDWTPDAYICLLY